MSERPPDGNSAPLEQSLGEPVSPPRSLPGPGLPESLLWTVGVHVAQAIGFVLVAMVLIVAWLIANDGPAVRPDAEWLRELSEQFSTALLAGPQLVFLLLAIVGARLRIGRTMPRRLALRGMRPGHGLLVILLVLPLAIMSQAVYNAFQAHVWRPLVERYPPLKEIDQLDVVQAAEGLVAEAPLLLLFVSVAAVPALAEELVFRGVIGRGLVARWGVVAGVGLTSLLFAVAHPHPAHAVAVLPLGVVLHFIYLATRSFWGPVLLHFLNNGLALVALKYAAPAAGAAPGADGPQLSLWVYLAAALSAAVLLTILWRTRVELRLPDGSVWSSGYASVEEPPPDVPAVRRSQRASPTIVALAGISLIALAVAFALTVREGAN